MQKWTLTIGFTALPLLPTIACREGWIAVGNRCFKYDTTKRDYKNSVLYCKSLGAQIASIHSDVENTIVTILIPDGETGYIGAESDGMGTWNWNDDSTWWQPADSKNDTIAEAPKNRIVINCPRCNNDKKWHDRGAGSLHGVVCAQAVTSGTGFMLAFSRELKCMADPVRDYESSLPPTLCCLPVMCSVCMHYLGKKFQFKQIICSLLFHLFIIISCSPARGCSLAQGILCLGAWQRHYSGPSVS